jgi:hypothetical protein
MGDEVKKKKVTANIKEITLKAPQGVTATVPDVCKTPSPAGPVPIPYPNIAKSSDTAKGSKKVKMDGNPVLTKRSSFEKSSGDEPGSFVKKHPVLTAVTILTVMVIVWILVSNILSTPKPFEPEEPIFSLNFWFS